MKINVIITLEGENYAQRESDSFDIPADGLNDSVGREQTLEAIKAMIAPVLRALEIQLTKKINLQTPVQVEGVAF